MNFGMSWKTRSIKEFLTPPEIRDRFLAIAACTQDGRPTVQQLTLNGMLERSLWN
jgi:hypothetical protein